MAESEFEIRRDEMERDSLQKTISDVETALAVSTPGTRPLFENLLHNAKGRIGALDKKIKDAQEARETHEREQAAGLALAERETALSAREKETYSGFLKEDFFTKKDFGRLEQFYTKTWDRLSEQGKDEMSKRIWGGIRHGQYSFSDLPPAVREKEMKQLHHRLTESAIGMGEAAEIPEKDRKEFIEAYEAGKKDEAAKVLERESFKRTMFRDGEAKGVKSVEVNKHRESESEQLLAGAKPASCGQAVTEKPQSPKGIGNQDFSTLQFSGMTVSESAAPAQPPLVANAVPINQRER
jgi:hypothetical protein